jgi:hypothetical protein
MIQDEVDAPWLLLVHQLPARPVSARVKAWRRLQQLGAVAIKNSVYALPNRPETREDFEWVRAEIVATGGQATVFQAGTIDSVSSDELRETFRQERQNDYAALAKAVDKLVRAKGGKRSRSPRPNPRAVRVWRDRLGEIESVDYFIAGGRDDARAAVGRLEALARRNEPAVPASDEPGLADPAAFARKRWLTRPRPGIDRMASAWLIRRFIDPQAEFAFGEPGERHDVGTVTFDMFEGDFTHEGDRCTFEVLCRRFALVDARLSDLAEIVHDLDLKDGRYGRMDAPLLGALVEGLRQRHDRDTDLLEQGIALFEALFEGRVGSPPPPSQRRALRAPPKTRGTRAKPAAGAHE